MWKLLLVALAPFVPATQPLGVDSVKAAFDAQQYAEAVKLASQQLPGLVKSGNVIDRVAVWELKGESHLMLKQVPLSAEAFSQAGAANPDEKAAAIDKVTAQLIKRSSAGRYQAKTAANPTTKPASFDLTDKQQRKSAIQSLYAEQNKQFTQAVASLDKASGLRPLVQGIKQLSEFRTLELAATGDTANYKAAIARISDHAATLMDDALGKMSTESEMMDRKARTTHSAIVVHGSYEYSVQLENGLVSSDKAQLADFAATCDDITQASDDFAKATAASDKLGKVRTRASSVKARAIEIMQHVYHTTD